MRHRFFYFTIALISFLSISAFGQSGSTRPRRVAPVDTSRTSNNNSNTATPSAKPTPQQNQGGLLDVQPYGTTPAGKSTTTTSSTAARPSTTPAPTGTKLAFELLQQKRYAEALAEAKQAATKDPNDPEAWKIAGFAGFNLKQYADAAADLQRAVDLQRAAKLEDVNTADALGQAYARSEKYDRALPLLVAATTRAGAQPDAALLYMRGYAEYKTGKSQDAEKSFNEVLKVNAKDSASLMMLGQIAYERDDLDATINALNRATLSDPRLASAWTLLATAYLRRASSSSDTTKADADYLGAIKAAEGLQKIKSDNDTTLLLAQALIGAKQYPRAIIVLERASLPKNAPSSILYLLGFTYSRSELFPKAIAILDRALAVAPNDLNIYRELGYAYEVTKQYPKAFRVYEKALTVAPNDPDFRANIERLRSAVRPG